MGAVIDRFAMAGVRFEAAGDGNLKVTGEITDMQREAIRKAKATVLTELRHPSAAGEFRRLVEHVLDDAPHEWDEAYEVGLADLDSALACYRLLAAERGAR